MPPVAQLLHLSPLPCCLKAKEEPGHDRPWKPALVHGLQLPLKAPRAAGAARDVLACEGCSTSAFSVGGLPCLWGWGEH